MYRTQLTDLEAWFDRPRRKPLVIRGARQVGKSTLVRQFAKEFVSSKGSLELYEINLEKHTALESVFATNDAKRIVQTIEDSLGKRILPAKPGTQALLFLDEVQACPAALAALRYLHEDMPELAVVAAGSLLEFELSAHSYSMPVGRIEFLHMGPMTLSEFALARGETHFAERIRDLQRLEEITPALHETGSRLYREFLFTGGMPEAVHEFVTTGEQRVGAIHAEILQVYEADFAKYSSKSSKQRIGKIFRYCFAHPCEKVKYSNISRESSSREVKHDLDLLIQAKVLSRVAHTQCSGIPLEKTAVESTLSFSPWMLVS